MIFACPKSHGTDFVLVAKTHRFEPRRFLWLEWLAAIHTGYIARCTDPGCARHWRVGLDGVHVPAGHGTPEAVQPALERPTRPPFDGEDEAEASPPLGLAIRRPRV